MAGRSHKCEKKRSFVCPRGIIHFVLNAVSNLGALPLSHSRFDTEKYFQNIICGIILSVQEGHACVHFDFRDVQLCRLFRQGGHKCFHSKTTKKKKKKKRVC